MRLHKVSFGSPLLRALILFGAALVFRAVYYAAISRTACLDINLDPISDMETFHRWALSIVNGDWLGTGNFHPFHPWQAAIAPVEEWDRWYGHVFHQEPLYPYLVALIYLVAPRLPASVIVAQLLMGAAGCAFVYLAARRIAPEGAAVGAGVLSVVYGPYLYYESLVLRDSFLIPLDALLLWVLLEARARAGSRRAWIWWCSGGLLGGAAFITKANILAFFILFLLWSVWEARARGGVNRAHVLALVAGFLVAPAPLVTRNLVVGAPALKITTRGPIEFINGNNPWHMGIGWFDGDDERVSSYARDILSRSSGELLPTAAAVLRGWSADPAGLVKLQLLKAAYFLAPFEMPNNASYSYFRINSSLLRHAALSFFWISPLALLGLWESRRRGRRFVPVYLFLGAGAASTIAFYVIARFRAPLMPAVMVLAGTGIWSLIEDWNSRRWGRLAAGGLMIAAVLTINTSADYTDRDLIRPQDYRIAIQGYRARGETALALREAEIARAHFAAFAWFHREAGALYLEAGRPREALAAFQDALARDPRDDELKRQVGRLEREVNP
jgi:4-amino-4-deoxy-L-arabinose transferase-like glycosyltransferase